MKLTDKIVNALGWDKTLHYAVGFAVCALVCYGGAVCVGVSAWQQAVAGTLTGALLGVGKELLDAKFDWADIAATLAGSLTMALLSLIINY